MTRECITHHICDCMAERLKRAEALAALRLEWYAKARADQERAEAEREALRAEPLRVGYLAADEIERLRDELHFKACLVRDLLPYQERAVKAEAERDALREDAEQWRNHVAKLVEIRKLKELGVAAPAKGEG